MNNMEYENCERNSLSIESPMKDNVSLLLAHWLYTGVLESSVIMYILVYHTTHTHTTTWKWTDLDKTCYQEFWMNY